MTAAADALRKLWEEVDAAVIQAGSYGLDSNVVAEGTRYATDLMRLALTLHLHDQDPDRPGLVVMVGPTLRWGWDNPHTTYHYAPIDGRSTYRLYGRRNTSAYVGVTVYGGGDERNGTMPSSVLGSINHTRIPVDSDGRWQVHLRPRGAAPTGQDGAALELDADAASIIVRQYVFDPEGRPSGLMYPTPDNLYTFGRYELPNDEALVVTVTPVACRYWSFYLGSLFQQSLPYGRDYGLITRESAHLESDGSVTFVISAEDPGRPNWLPTQNHRQGMMALRWLLPEVDDAPLPASRLVPFGEL